MAFDITQYRWVLIPRANAERLYGNDYEKLYRTGAQRFGDGFFVIIGNKHYGKKA